MAGLNSRVPLMSEFGGPVCFEWTAQATSAVTLYFIYLMAGVPQITADLMQRRKSAAVGPGRVSPSQ